MSEQQSRNERTLLRLDVECFVYRKGIWEQHYNPRTRELRRQAFMRRDIERDPKGVSVNHSCTIEYMVQRDPKPIAIGRLIVKEIKAVSATPQLDVIADSKTHANITGLPLKGENIPEAERLAELLKNICTRIYPK